MNLKRTCARVHFCRPPPKTALEVNLSANFFGDHFSFSIYYNIIFVRVANAILFHFPRVVCVSFFLLSSSSSSTALQLFWSSFINSSIHFSSFRIFFLQPSYFWAIHSVCRRHACGIFSQWMFWFTERSELKWKTFHRDFILNVIEKSKIFNSEMHVCAWWQSIFRKSERIIFRFLFFTSNKVHKILIYFQ